MTKDSGCVDQMVARTCPCCGAVFTLTDLLESPEIEPLGMQFMDDALSVNELYFTHHAPRCGTTFVVPVLAFAALITEPIPTVNLCGTEVCSRKCATLIDVSACDVPCRYAPFRRLLNRMLHLRSSQSDGPGSGAHHGRNQQKPLPAQ
jgi:hypothetical protein